MIIFLTPNGLAFHPRLSQDLWKETPVLGRLEFICPKKKTTSWKYSRLYCRVDMLGAPPEWCSKFMVQGANVLTPGGDFLVASSANEIFSFFCHTFPSCGKWSILFVYLTLLCMLTDHWNVCNKKKTAHFLCSRHLWMTVTWALIFKSAWFSLDAWQPVFSHEALLARCVWHSCLVVWYPVSCAIVM